MKTLGTPRLSLAGAITAGLVFALPARADLITVTTGAASFSAGGDVITLFADTVPLNVTPGVPLTANFQSGNFHVGDSGQLNDTFPYTLSRTVGMNGVNMTGAQPGTLQITPTMDTMTILNGPLLTYNLSPDTTLQFMPLGTVKSATALGDFPFQLQGTFLLQAIPEPASVMLFALGAVAMLGFVRRWSKRAA